MQTESSVSRVLVGLREERKAINPPAPTETNTFRKPSIIEPVPALARSTPEPVMLDDKDLVDDNGDAIEEILDFIEVEKTPEERFSEEWAFMERLHALDMQRTPIRFHPDTIASIRRLMLLATSDSDRLTVCVEFASVLEFNAGFGEVADEELADWFKQSKAIHRSLDEAMRAARRAAQLMNEQTPNGERIKLLTQLVRHLNARRSPEARSFEMQLQYLLSSRP